MANGFNGYLQYEIGGTIHTKFLRIESINQPLQVTGTSAQGRTSRQFYPRAHAPGDIAVVARCVNQKELQEFGLFVREHQRALINTPGSVMFNRTDTNSVGYRRLMKLYVSKEGTSVRGFVPRFTVLKKGVFEPAPQFTFNFTVIFDPYAENISVSQTIRKYYNDADNYSSNKAIEVDPVGAGHQTNAEGIGP